MFSFCRMLKSAYKHFDIVVENSSKIAIVVSHLI